MSLSKVVVPDLIYSVLLVGPHGPWMKPDSGAAGLDPPGLVP